MIKVTLGSTDRKSVILTLQKYNFWSLASHKIITNGIYKKDSGLQCPLTTYQKMQLCLTLSKNTENRWNLAYVFDCKRGHFKSHDQEGALANKTLCERIFGRGRTTGMILRTCLIAAKELSSYLTREEKSFTPLVCWTTQLIQYVPIHNKNSVTSRQCLKICTSSMQTCLEPNYNIGHKWLQPRE